MRLKAQQAKTTLVTPPASHNSASLCANVGVTNLLAWLAAFLQRKSEREREREIYIYIERERDLEDENDNGVLKVTQHKRLQ